jgi:hypothetical protein
MTDPDSLQSAISRSAGHATPTDMRMMWNSAVNPLRVRAASRCDAGISAHVHGAPSSSP